MNQICAINYKAKLNLIHSLPISEFIQSDAMAILNLFENSY